MKRISTVLNESEAMAVRKAVFIAGAERVVISTIPYQKCVDTANIYSEKSVSASIKHVRLDVMTDNSRFSSVISAIHKIADAVRIDRSSHHDVQSRYAA